LSGTFTAPLGQSATNPTNRIEVAGRSATNCDGPCPLIDNPDLDPGEDVNVYPGANKYSLVAPPFLGAGAASFAPKEQQVTNCSNVYVCVPNEIEGQTCSSFCRPALGLDINVTLNNGHGAKLPGSIGAFHVPSRCEPGSTDPERLKGCEILADLFASLGPKGFTVYDVRLEPSPGSQRDVDLRQGIANSTTPWVTKRGAPDDGGDGLVSNTRVRLATNGGGDIRASGLCPAAGCASPKVLTVRIYGGQASEPAGETVLQLNSKGDGKADLGFSLPCVDPAVLVIDPLDHSWVAAPAIF